MNWTLAALAAYLVLQLAIGAWVAPRIRTEEDFLVGGRSMGYPLTVFSIFATWFGAESCIASAGRAYRDGFSLTSAEPFAYGLTLIAMGLIFAVPLWRRKLTTMADLFRHRYGAGVEKLAALVLIPSSLFWAAAQLRGFGHVLTTIADIDINVAIAAAAGVCIVYTMLGGLLADAITDLVQGAVLIIGLVMLAVVVILRHGGLGAATDSISASQFRLVDPGVTPSALGMLEEWAIPIAGSVVAAELVSRVIAARSPSVARNGALLGGGLYMLVGILPVFIGLAGVSLIPVVADSEQFLPAIARALLSPLGYVVFAGALVSAILSTVDTILLVTSGLATHNIIAPAFGITSDRRRILMARIGVVVLGGLALLMAQHATGVGDLVEEASSFGSAGLVVVVSFALFSNVGGPVAATTTLIGGLVAYLAGSLIGVPYPFLTSLGTATALYLGVALVERGSARPGWPDALNPSEGRPAAEM